MDGKRPQIHLQILLLTLVGRFAPSYEQSLLRPFMMAFFVVALMISVGSSAGMSQAIKKPGDASALVIEAKIPLGAVTGRIDHMALV